MDYGHDDDPGLLKTEVDAEGKARHQRTTRIPMNNGVAAWLFGNETKGGDSLVQKRVPKTFTLLFVP